MQDMYCTVKFVSAWNVRELGCNYGCNASAGATCGGADSRVNTWHMEWITVSCAFKGLMGGERLEYCDWMERCADKWDG